MWYYSTMNAGADQCRDNVLFGLPFNEERYRKTLKVCALEKVCNFVLIVGIASLLTTFRILNLCLMVNSPKSVRTEST